ncbi:hypothetical protein E2C01_025754 [Portunus trituberculatus]|uniref:Uncharacterized protein n=1 Tax=Portunus trituberculatus TaxID=210409 RepID=A0A5B7EIT7_PORTR|nr:hypothetical protein [Portunus trituberculatus]
MLSSHTRRPTPSSRVRGAARVSAVAGNVSATKIAFREEEHAEYIIKLTPVEWRLHVKVLTKESLPHPGRLMVTSSEALGGWPGGAAGADLSLYS